MLPIPLVNLRHDGVRPTRYLRTRDLLETYGEYQRRGARIVWKRRIKDLLALLLIGDGALTILSPRNRALLWRFGPERFRKSTGWQAEHPSIMRLEGAASIAFGVWLALRQYREPPGP